MLRLFGASGFKPRRDIAAIVLNRWGHARLIEPPGFHYGVDGKPSPLERVRQGYGRISIGHSELNGAQHWGSALEYGRKAGERAAASALTGVTSKLRLGNGRRRRSLERPPFGPNTVAEIRTRCKPSITTMSM